MEDLCVSIYIQLFSLQYNHKGDGTLIKGKKKEEKNDFPHWNSQHGKQLDPIR